MAAIMAVLEFPPVMCNNKQETLLHFSSANYKRTGIMLATCLNHIDLCKFH